MLDLVHVLGDFVEVLGIRPQVLVFNVQVEDVKVGQACHKGVEKVLDLLILRLCDLNVWIEKLDDACNPGHDLRAQ